MEHPFLTFLLVMFAIEAFNNVGQALTLIWRKPK